MPLDPRQVPLRRPAAVAVHDDGEVPRAAGRSRPAGRAPPPRNPGARRRGCLQGTWGKRNHTNSQAPTPKLQGRVVQQGWTRFEAGSSELEFEHPWSWKLELGSQSIVHMRQKQALRRRRPAGLRAVVRVEHGQQTPRVPSADPDLDQRADDVPDHVPQESIAGDADHQRQVESAAVFDRRAARMVRTVDATGRAGSLERRRNRALPISAPRRGAHRLEVERLRDVPDVAAQERRDERRIRRSGTRRSSRGRRTARGTRARHLFDGQHAHVGRQHRVQRARERRLVERLATVALATWPARARPHRSVRRRGSSSAPPLDRRERVLEQPLNRRCRSADAASRRNWFRRTEG